MTMEIINGLTFNIPEGFHELNVLRHAKATDAALEEGKNDSHKLIGILAEILGTNADFIKRSPIEDIDKLIRQEGEEFKGSLAWYFGDTPKIKIEPTFTIDGIEYHYPEDIGDRTFGEFVHLDTLANDHSENLWHIVPSVMAIYCRKKGDGEDYSKEFTQREAAFQKMTVKQAESIAAFFLTKGEVSKLTSLRYSQDLIAAIKSARTLESSLKATAGWQPFTTSLRATILKSLKSQLQTVGRFWSPSTL